MAEPKGPKDQNKVDSKKSETIPPYVPPKSERALIEYELEKLQTLIDDFIANNKQLKEYRLKQARLRAKLTGTPFSEDGQARAR